MHLDKECPLNKEVKTVKEVKYGEFRKPSTYNGGNGASLNMYALADLGASFNIMPFSMFKSLGLINLKETTFLVEMACMSKRAPRGIVENVLVKINKFEFPSDFVIIDMVGDPHGIMILDKVTTYSHHENYDVTSLDNKSGQCNGDEASSIILNPNYYFASSTRRKEEGSETHDCDLELKEYSDHKECDHHTYNDKPKFLGKVSTERKDDRSFGKLSRRIIKSEIMGHVTKSYMIGKDCIKIDSPLAYNICSPNVAFKNCRDLSSSGGVLYTRQAYDRIDAMTKRLGDHPKMKHID
nr:hypothetical protein [Tanacetum cinerariifolium]